LLQPCIWLEEEIDLDMQAELKKRRLEARETSDNPVRNKAADELQKFLITKWCCGVLPASDVCLISHLITNAGGEGVAHFALPPETCSMHGHEHMLSCLGKQVEQPSLVNVSVPVYEKRDTCRKVTPIPVHLPTAIIRNQLRVKHRASAKDVGAVFLNHPAKLAADARGVPAVPISLYTDGVEYNEKDSFYCFCVNNLLTQQTAMICMLRCWAHVIVSMSSVDSPCIFPHYIVRQAQLIGANVAAVDGAASTLSCSGWPKI
jgi:hypothetical protein